MKASFSLLALASPVLAANIPRGGGGHGGWGEVATHVLTTYTTLCPVTETITKGGKPQYVTYTDTSVVTKVVPVTYYTTIEKVDTKTAYTTFIKTAWEETKVYQTVTCPETVVTTVSAGHTISITKTNTITKYVTDVKTYTKNVPVTVTKNVDTTIAITQPAGATITGYSTVVVSVPNTVYSSLPAPPPTTIILPVTSTAVQPPAATTTPPAVTAAGHHNVPAGVALVVGFVGAVAIL